MTLEIPIVLLDAHPLNSNVMPEDRLAKLAAHLERTGRYPPVIVRRLEGGRYQILDGHHRVAALRRVGAAAARCDVWHVDDAEALRLLATLNRLQGEDDAKKRGTLLAELRTLTGETLAELAAALPERVEHVERLVALADTPPAPRRPRDLEEMPVAVTFFLSPAQKREVEGRLRALGGEREAALMTLVRGSAGHA